MAHKTEEYNEIIKNMYSNNYHEDVKITLYDIDSDSELYDDYPVYNGKISDDTHTKNILILGFRFLMKKMKNKSIKISNWYKEMCEMRTGIAEMRNEMCEKQKEMREKIYEQISEIKVLVSEMREDISKMKNTLDNMIDLE